MPNLFDIFTSVCLFLLPHSGQNAGLGRRTFAILRQTAGYRRVTALWLRRPLPVSQHGQRLPYLRGRLMSSNPCYSGLRRQTAEGMVSGVVYRPRQRVLSR